MGKRGFTAKPLAIRMTEGTYRHDRHGNCVVPFGIPSKPKRLKGAAAAHWRWVCDRLEIIGVLAKTDVQAIARYCEALTEYDVATEEMAKFGHLRVVDGELKLTPCVRVTNALRIELRRMEQEFGLTPASRASLHVQPQAESVVSSRKRG